MMDSGSEIYRGAFGEKEGVRKNAFFGNFLLDFDEICISASTTALISQAVGFSHLWML